MMTTVVDTSVLIDHLRGNEDARRILRRAVDSGERLTASVLTKVEILAGMREGEQAATVRLLAALDGIEIDDELADRAGWLANRYLRSHPGVDSVDYVIAATVARLNAALWTRNVKHFPMFPELKTPY